MEQPPKLARRRFLATLGAGLALGMVPARVIGDPAAVRTKTIPSGGKSIPVIGMGTWITFNVGADPVARNARTELMRVFFEEGGGIIDSSPMYGSSEEVIGHGLARLGPQPKLFSASKVWISSTEEGRAQIAESHRRWGIERFDLLQVHNLVNWQGHLHTLSEMKAKGRLHHVGITTSHGRRHDELEKIMRTLPVDFVQATYNIRDREVEERILPLAAERGIAFIANRPFQGGTLIERVQRHPLPAWAAEIDCANWAQFLLKFIVSHPAVTCAIPATTRIDHLRENMGAASGIMPNSQQRLRMAAHLEAL